MANPTNFEAVFDRVEAQWGNQPFVRKTHRFEALPLILVLCVFNFVLLWGSMALIELFGADWEMDKKSAVWMGCYLVGGFSIFMTAMVRSAKRNVWKEE